jgi:hypothetical protein
MGFIGRGSNHTGISRSRLLQSLDFLIGLRGIVDASDPPGLLGPDHYNQSLKAYLSVSYSSPRSLTTRFIPSRRVHVSIEPDKIAVFSLTRSFSHALQ